MTHKSFYLTTAFALGSLIAHAQQTGTTAPVTHGEFVSNTVYILVGSVIVVLLIAFLVMLHHNTQLIKTIYGLKQPASVNPDAPIKEQAVESEPSLLDNLYHTFIMPKRKRDEDLMLDHDYDGIKELDNRMPPWLKYVFFGTILFAFIYLMRYTFDSDWSSKKEYDEEVAAANTQKATLLGSQKNTVDESNIVQLTDAKSLSAGKAIYLEKCMACHGAAGEGLVGPNLTDEYWIHGCSMAEVFETIKYGVPAKGMLTWNGVLNADQIAQVASYVLSLKGTNPPNPKAPQGDKCKPGITSTDDADKNNAIGSSRTESNTKIKPTESRK